MFSTRLDNFLPFSSNLKLSSANSFSLEESKICRLVMGWKLMMMRYYDISFGHIAFQDVPNLPIIIQTALILDII